MNKQTNIKPNYKKTPVGIIPEDWEVKTFKDCFEQLKTYTFSRNQLTYDENENCIYNIHYGDIHATFPKNILDTEKNLLLIPKIIDAQIKEPVLLKEGDLIMADASEDYEGVGQSIELINIGDKKIVSGTHTFALREKKKFAPKYKGFIFSAFNTHKELKKIATGISVFGLSKSNISKIKLPIPPLPEQKAIADCLSTWDRAIEKQTQLIAAKKDFKKGLMQGFFNGHFGFAQCPDITKLRASEPEQSRRAEARLQIIKAKEGEDFTEDWEEVRLGEFFKESKVKSEVNDKTKRMSVRLHLEGIDKREVRGTEADSTQFYQRKAGQFIYGKQNFHNGALGIIPEEFDGFETTSDIPSFDINNKVNHQFIFYLLIRKDFYEKMENKTTGTGSKRLHPQEFLNTKVKMPVLNIQSAIAQVLQSADREIELLEKKLAQLQLQKKGLMQVLLTGEKRLV